MCNIKHRNVSAADNIKTARERLHQRQEQQNTLTFKSIPKKSKS